MSLTLFPEMDAPVPVTYGTATLVENDGGRWRLDLQPHVAVMAKRIFPKIDKASKVLCIPADPETCRDLEWFVARYPLIVKPREVMAERSAMHGNRIQMIENILSGSRSQISSKLALPPRPHQQLAADWALAVERGLLGDEMGVGKTCTAILTIVQGGLFPALIVCPSHLCRQWKQELERFVPDVRVQILKTSKAGPLKDRKGRAPDVVISSYTMLHGWDEYLKNDIRMVVFDECQELRCPDSRKYNAAKVTASVTKNVLGMSGTPTYNYGGEIFNVMNVITPERLGNQTEFHREWCSNHGRHWKLNDPDAFGSWLQSNHLMLRRTREDVGNALPELQTVTHTVDIDSAELEKVTGTAGELARIILGATQQSRGDKMRASERFSDLLRQATGLAKARFVASFVDLLIQNGEKVILFGWHHAVYDIWATCLAAHNPVRFTGEQSAAQKASAVEQFKSGKSKCFIMSLRSGAGLDGLQFANCAVGVFGELDWSPQVHRQCICRFHRDGQKKRCMAYYLLSSDGMDPIMATVLGLKKAQSDGILGIQNDGPKERIDSSELLTQLAVEYAKKTGLKNPSVSAVT